jgi:type VI secretion system protein VasJ
MVNTVTELEQLGTVPVADDTPCGVSVRYELEYEQLQAEVAKMDALTPQPVNWEQVVEIAAGILKNKSKDLLVASYLSHGLFSQHGYEGLEAALTLYRDLILNYWESLFPEKKRMRGRIAAMEWLAERLGKAITQQGVNTSNRDNVRRCYELAQEFEALLEERLGAEAPDLTALYSPLRDGLSMAPDPAPDPTPDPVPNPIPDPTPQTSSSESRTEFENERDAMRAIRACQSTIRHAVDFLLKHNPTDILPYSLIRRIAWLLIVRLPGHQNGRTELPSPSPDVLQRCQHYLQSERFAELITAAEAACVQTPFWLDAQRYSVRALEGRGAAYVEARRTVVEELASFTRRLPGILDLSFTDGTPFADEVTRRWIDEEVLMCANRGSAMPRVGWSNDFAAVALLTRDRSLETVDADEIAATSIWQEASSEAKQLSLDGKVKEGLALLQGHETGASSQRERFRWRLQQARLCVELDRLELATPQLEFLDAQIARFGLEEWEPALSLEVLSLLLYSYQRLAGTSTGAVGDAEANVSRIYTRLCQLDITAAIAVSDGVTSGEHITR